MADTSSFFDKMGPAQCAVVAGVVAVGVQWAANEGLLNFILSHPSRAGFKKGFEAAATPIPPPK